MSANQTITLVIASVFPLLFIILWPILTLKKQNFNFKEALSEPGSGGQSASRLLLFISGYSAILFSYIFIVFYIYAWLELPFWCSSGKCKEMPNFNEVINGLLALGIGVIPYSINKISTAVSNNLSIRKINPSILMKNITYKVTIKNGQGQLAVKTAQMPTLKFDKSGSQSHSLGNGDHLITVACSPPITSNGIIEFEIWVENKMVDNYTFKKEEVIGFNITV